MLRFWCQAVLLIAFGITAQLAAREVQAEPIQRQLAQYLGTERIDRPEAYEASVHAFYQRHAYLPVWIGGHGLQRRAYQFFKRILFAERDGLDPKDYRVDEIRRLWKLNQPGNVALEVMLTQAFVDFTRDLYQGRLDPSQIKSDWYIAAEPLDIERLLQDLHADKSMPELLDKLEPRHPAYLQLRAQLRRYRNIAQQGGWPQIPSGPVLRPGMRHDQVPLIRARLRITGDLVSGSLSSSWRYDQALSEAVMHFQARHGIAIDGQIGAQTRRAMNATVHQRITQILINMERWRWLPRDLGQRYLMVNLAGFELYAEEDGQVALAMPIIIGKQYRATPSFSSHVRYMEVNPFWTIPKRIVLEDLIPVQLQQADYFARKQIRIFDGWHEDAQEIQLPAETLQQLNWFNFPFRFRQDPGPQNSLGQIKFMFPNPYAIYLHDTPQRHLFERRVRTFSSGCIRVSEPIRLAAYLLGEIDALKQQKVRDLIALGDRHSLSLPISVPIYLIYWTAWADASGDLHLRKDFYRRDERIRQFMNLSKN